MENQQEQNTADESMTYQPPPPTPQHEWLAQLEGEWTTTMETSMGPGAPEETWEGRESVRRLGDYWVVCEAVSPTPGGSEGRSIMSLGFDPDKGRFVGTFIGSMMTTHWVYDGELDESGTQLSLHSNGPAMDGSGATMPYKDVIELKDGRRSMTAWMQVEGEWQQFMTMTYTKVG